jgi:maltose 6'-phosphate phosphatase
MKLLTLNLHLWAEDDQINKLKKIANFIKENDVDVCFFQEVAQLESNEIIVDNIRKDNNAYLIKEYLDKDYYLYFEYKKNGREVYNEGLAILSKYPLINKEWFYVSKIRDHKNWHTRIIVKASINYNNEIIDLYSTHMGWDEGIERYFDQVDEYVKNINFQNKFILAGDFNCVYESEQYDYLLKNKLISLVEKSNIDPYLNPTFHYKLDFPMQKDVSNGHIDYFFTNNKDIKVNDYNIYFNKDNNLVSDHHLVMVDIDI